MGDSFKSNLFVCVALLRRDVKIMMQFLFDNIIDSLILVGFIYLMYAKLLPLVGISTAMVTPAFLGVLVVVMINVAFDRALKDAMDFQYTRFVDYQIMLPITMRWLVVKYIVSYTIDLFLASFPVLCFGRLLFGPMLDITHSNLPLFFTIYFMSMVLLGSILLCVVVAKPFHWVIENTWPRVLLPMTLLGSLYYPWAPVAKFLPLLSKAMLILPTVYIAEGLRSAGTGNALYLPAHWCAFALMIFIIIVISMVFVAMRKRIDPVG